VRLLPLVCTEKIGILVHSLAAGGTTSGTVDLEKDILVCPVGEGMEMSYFLIGVVPCIHVQYSNVWYLRLFAVLGSESPFGFLNNGDQCVGVCDRVNYADCYCELDSSRPFLMEPVNVVEFVEHQRGVNIVTLPIQRQLCSNRCFVKVRTDTIEAKYVYAHIKITAHLCLPNYI
jgi:hypothetical protein